MRTLSLRAALAATLVGWAALWALGLIGVRFHPVIALAVPLVLLGTALLTRVDPSPPAFPVTEPAAPPLVPTDRRLSTLTWLLRDATSSRGWDSGVRPHLAQLTRDRLRERHAVDVEDDPRRARALLGEDLWDLVSGTTPAPRTDRDLIRLIERIQSL
ncbi:hypothetical protein [Actinomyces faecalis]|uniref:hypothetical protein n=1 Tax=Actinomyces faecalis TaxID=2722820 RepID=UPI00155544BB|nr:hypothetical protein [Actinomyces faecalis]